MDAIIIVQKKEGYGNSPLMTLGLRSFFRGSKIVQGLKKWMGVRMNWKS